MCLYKQYVCVVRMYENDTESEKRNTARSILRHWQGQRRTTKKVHKDCIWEGPALKAKPKKLPANKEKICFGIFVSSNYYVHMAFPLWLYEHVHYL